MRVGLVVMVASLSAFTLSMFQRHQYNLYVSTSRVASTPVWFFRLLTPHPTQGSVEYERKNNRRAGDCFFKHYKFSGKDEDLSVSVSVSRNDGSATISSSVNGYVLHERP